MSAQPHEGVRRAAPIASLVLAVPTALTAALAAAMAWREHGSILAQDWLPYAVLLALLVAVVLATRVAVFPSRAALVALTGLGGLAVWDAISAFWAPLPADARDEALLVATYVLALAVPLLTLRSAAGRGAAAGAVVAVAAGLALATALALAFGNHPDDRYDFGRLVSPVGYVNACAALFLVAFWPAVALAARRGLNVVLRSLAAGAGTSLLAAGLLTQSKGGAFALAVSAVVVLALSRARLRLLVPALGMFVLVAVSYDTLTEPFRADGTDALVDAARSAGGRVLVLAVVGLALGAAYGLLDERIVFPGRARRVAGQVVAGLALAALLGGSALFLVRIDHPVGWFGDRWDNFKRLPQHEQGSSHLVNLGSNRYDFWRVALDEFRSHPVGGDGARGWSVAYLQHGRSNETPLRAHSLEFDTASETGLVGLALLALALVPLLVILGRRARDDLLAAGLLAAAVYFVVHASGDWIWTFPAVGIPFFLLAGIGLTRDDPPALSSRAGIPLAALAVLVALVAFVPPWLSARITTRELEQPGRDPHADLRWARRLDPLSVEPLLAEAQLTGGVRAIAPLERTVDREPRAAAVRYLLGVAELSAGRRADALRELEEAQRLSPRDPQIAKALRRARSGQAAG